MEYDWRLVESTIPHEREWPPTGPVPSPVQAQRALQRGNLGQQPRDVAVHPHALVIGGGAAVVRCFTKQRVLPSLPVSPDARERLAPVFRGAIQQPLEAPPR